MSESAAIVCRTRSASAFVRVAAIRFRVAARAVTMGQGASLACPFGDGVRASRASA